MKVKKHPILGEEPFKKKVQIIFEGQIIEAEEGDPVAVALMNAGVKNFRTTSKNEEPRGVFCAIGRCTDCMMTINGIQNIRTCITLVENGMVIEKGSFKQ